MAVGSVHLIETLEFLDALRRARWDGPILLDQFPFREDPIVAARRSVAMLQLLDSRLDRIDLGRLRAAQSRQDALDAQDLIHGVLLGV